MKNNFQWMSGRLLVKCFRKWVEKKGLVAPSYKIIERIEENSFKKLPLTNRQRDISELAAEFRAEWEQKNNVPTAQAA